MPGLPIRTPHVERMPKDAITLARCMVLDADVFPYPSAAFGLAVRDASCRAWVVRAEGGKLAGFLVSFIRTGSKARAIARGRVLHIAGIAVAPEERGRGFGRALVRAAKVVLEGREVAAIALEVATTNDAAVALYRSEGFVIERLRKGFYGRTGGDAYEMVARNPN